MLGLSRIASIAKLTTLCCLISIATAKDWYVSQLNVNNAFICGDLHVKVYMSLPPRYIVSDSLAVWWLNNSLYRLKQASCQWFEKLTLSSCIWTYSVCRSPLAVYSNKRQFFSCSRCLF